MIRPWQVWCLFAICLMVAVPAMGWLTLKAVQLDRAEAEARSIAELEQEIGWALWQMDTAVTPLLAHEAARPHFLYQSFISNSVGGKTVAEPSPLLKQPSEFVRLHFQFDSNNQWSSPQLPSHPAKDQGLSLTDEQIGRNGKLLAELEAECRDVDFLAMLPKETFDDIELNMQTDRAPPSAASNRAPVENESSEQTQQQAVVPVLRNNNVQLLQGISNNSSAEAQFEQRSRAYQNFGQQAVRQQRAENPWKIAFDDPVREGISRPLWVGEQLLFCRRVTIGGQTVIQGCWLDWPRLKQWLLEDTGSYLPGADLIPMSSYDPQFRHRMLASLPVALEVSPRPVRPPTAGPIRIALIVAWGCLLLATVAVAVLLMGVIRLSERRASFVSAVTHELRTPLTTFRMYSEMLSQNMVQDPDQRSRYLRTLATEADRLAHLVENVLAFARLERGRSNATFETVTVHQLLDRPKERLGERAAAARMEIQWQNAEGPDQIMIRTNCSAVEQILFNLIENACKYADQAEDRIIRVESRVSSSDLLIRVADGGPGISKETAKRLFRPFHKSSEEAARTAPGVGLGLALCRRLARELGGDLQLDKSESSGACFRLRLPLRQTH